ncbi:heat stress transcription factor B-4-like protein [Tanacetum coccineum]
MYGSGRVDIFDMVDIDLFTIVALNMMVLKLGYTCESEPMFYNYLSPLTSLDVGLYALACEEDVRCLTTLARSFELIEVYIEHGVTVLDSYLRAPRFRATLEDITDEPTALCHNMIQVPLVRILFLSGAHGVDTQSHVLPTIQSQFSDINLSFVSQQATASQVIDDVMRQLSFDETELDGEACFANVMGSGVDSSWLSHDESFGVDDLDLNLNEPVNLNVSQAETQSELPVFEEPDVGPTQEPILAEVSTQEPIVAEEFSVEDVVIKDYVSSEEDGEDAEHDDDDDVDEDFLLDEENEIVEPDVDVHLFGISMDLPFNNIGITNLVSDNILEGEDVDVVNADGFDSDPGNGEERNYRKRRLAELRTEMEGVINASGQCKRNLKLYKNDSVKIRARCEGKLHVFTMSQGTTPTGPNSRMEAWPSGLSGPTTKSKKRKNTGTNDDSQASPSFLDAHDKRDLCPWVLINLDILIKAVQDQLQRELEVQISMSKAFRAKAKAKREIRGDHIAVERNTDPSLPTRVFQRIYVCLGALKLGFISCKKDLLGLDGAFMMGPFPGQVLVAVGLDLNNGIYPLAYVLVEAESKSSWCWFLQCLGDDIDLHPNLNFTFISDRQKGWCRRAYKDLLWRVASATNVRDFEKCMLELKTMNAKAHEWLNKIPAEHWAISHFSGRAKSDLLLNNICEVFNSKIVRGRDKPMITLLEYIMEYCMKRIVNVQGVIDKYTGPLTPTATRIMESIKKEAHLMKEMGIDRDSLTKYWEKSTCPTTLLPPKHHVHVGLTRKKIKRSKHEDEPFMKDGKLSRKGRTITCQSCENTGHNKATCKVQGRKATTGGNNAEASGSASRQVQQTKPAAGQDGSGRLGAGAVIERISPQKRTPTQPASQPSTSSQVPLSETRNADGREMGDGVPTQSSATGGASEWYFL